MKEYKRSLLDQLTRPMSMDEFGSLRLAIRKDMVEEFQEGSRSKQEDGHVEFLCDRIAHLEAMIDATRQEIDCMRADMRKMGWASAHLVSMVYKTDERITATVALLKLEISNLTIRIYDTIRKGIM